MKSLTRSRSSPPPGSADPTPAGPVLGGAVQLPPQAATLNEPATSPFDPRVDQLGFVAELQKQFADDLKTVVKTDMLGADEDRRRGESFEAVLVQGTTQTVNPERWVKLYETGRITRAQFMAALSVRRDHALDALGRDELAKISFQTTNTPALRVSRIKGVQVSLVDAVRSLAAAVAR